MSHSFPRKVTYLLGLLRTLLLSITCAGLCTAVAAGGPLPVFVSIPPQAYFVKRIGGGHVEVHVLLPAGATAETYEPRPSDLRELTRARLYVRAGVPFEASIWNHIVEVNPRMKIVNAGMSSKPHDHARVSAIHDDPHFWLDPQKVKAHAAAINAALKALDPENAPSYDRNLKDLSDELDQLDAKIRQLLSPVHGKTFWVYHPAWGHFARVYGLQQCAIEREGKEPGPGTLRKLVDEARRERVRTIFIQPQFNRAMLSGLASEIGARTVVLDDLAKDYPANLYAAAEAILEALK